jgi:fermentation-respiration switch protein FrsA (DUF1100 family)
MNHGVNAVVKLIAAGAFLYVLYCGLLFFAQRPVLFPRTLIPAAPPVDLSALGIEPLDLETGFGRVESWYLPPAAHAPKPCPAVIFAHGNGELIDFWPQELRRFSQMGLGLLLVEYPGYGRSAGSPSQASIAEAFDRAYDRLAARADVDPSRIIFFGRSLGGGAVCDLATRRPAAALILMSCFTSVRSFAARYLAPSFLIRDPFDNLAAVGRFEGPVLVIHGRSDEVIPFGHGRALDAAARHGRLIAYEAGHNDCPPDWRVFWSDVDDFLRGNRIL